MSITRIAPAPTRATSSVTLSAGLITIPLSVYTSVETTTVARHEFMNGNPDIKVGRIAIRRDTNTIIDSADVTRMAQADDGTWVVLTDDEISDCVGLAGACEVLQFVPIKDTDQYLTDGLYQVRPKNEKRGGGAAVAAFGLLLAGMSTRKVHALVRFAMRGTPRYALLTANGDLLLIATADAIRAALPLPDTKPSKAEVDMVVSLIDAIGVSAPHVMDCDSVKVRTYVNTKAKAGGVASSTSGPLPSYGGDVLDIMERLQASIDEAKKAKAKPAPKSKAKRTTAKTAAA